MAHLKHWIEEFLAAPDRDLEGLLGELSRHVGELLPPRPGDPEDEGAPGRSSSCEDRDPEA